MQIFVTNSVGSQGNQFLGNFHWQQYFETTVHNFCVNEILSTLLFQMKLERMIDIPNLSNRSLSNGLSAAGCPAAAAAAYNPNG